MFCPSCGAESGEGLRFCKQCGSGLTLPLNPEYVRPIRLTGAVWAIAIMAFLCFGALCGSILGLAAMGVRDGDTLGPIGVVGAIGIVAISALMIRMVSRAAGTAVPVAMQQAANKQAIRSPNSQAQIPAHQEYIPSVTENTTRSFDRQSGESSSR